MRVESLQIRGGVQRRIMLWALAGFIVASGWAAYAFAFPAFERSTALGRTLWTLAEITCPVAILGKYTPLKFYTVFALNAATYACIGLAVELIRASATRPARLP